MNMNGSRTAASGSTSIGMSPKTKRFLQKICYKTPASVDMTQYGFICDSKVTPVNLLLKPLRQKLEKICGPSKPEDNKKIQRSVTKAPRTKKTVRTARHHLNKNTIKAYIATIPRVPVKPKRAITEGAGQVNRLHEKKIEKIVPCPTPEIPEQTVRKSRVTFQEPCTTIMINAKCVTGKCFVNVSELYENIS